MTIVAAGSIAYLLSVRPWQLRWGATAAEVAESLPGDELVPHPKLQTTRAITIQTPPSQVWPWLVQMGWARAGFYSYDALENLMGLGIHSANRILPEFQSLKVGDVLPWDREGGLPVRLIEQAAVLGVGGTMDPHSGKFVTPGDAPIETVLDASWVFVLKAQDDHATRLLARARFAYESPLVALGMHLVLEAAHFVMERKMLLGIKARAEDNWYRPENQAAGNGRGWKRTSGWSEASLE